MRRSVSCGGAVLLVSMAAACSGAPTTPAPTPDPAPATTAAAAPSAVATRPDATPAPAASSSQTVPGPRSDSAPATGRCAGERVLLEQALADPACARARPKPVPALAAGVAVLERVTTEPLTVRSGKWMTFDVAIRSSSGATITLLLDPPSAAWGGIGDAGDFDASALEGIGTIGVGGPRPSAPSKPARPAPPPAPEPEATSGFQVASTDSKGRSTDHPAGVAILGLIGLGSELGAERRVIRVDLAPRGAAVSRVRWRAVGYDPDKPVKTPPGADPTQGVVLPDPTPLKPGTYRLFVSAPTVGGELVSGAIEVTVVP